MNKDFFINQLEGIINDFKTIKSKAKNHDLSGNTSTEEIVTALTKSKAAVARIAGLNSEYYKEIQATLMRTNILEGVKLKVVIGSVIALKDDLENNYLRSLEDIIKSDIFSDYLEMAAHLLDKGFQDPATVLIGSTLEASLRELCLKHNINTEYTNSKGKLIPKRADEMNSDLAKRNIYSSANQKQITTWLALRNFAAHGKYDEYSKEEVNLMLKGIRHFITTTT